MDSVGVPACSWLLSNTLQIVLFCRKNIQSFKCTCVCVYRIKKLPQRNMSIEKVVALPITSFVAIVQFCDSRVLPLAIN